MQVGLEPKPPNCTKAAELLLTRNKSSSVQKVSSLLSLLAPISLLCEGAHAHQVLKFSFQLLPTANPSRWRFSDEPCSRPPKFRSAKCLFRVLPKQTWQSAIG